MSTYEQALRDCLLDCKAIIEAYRDGSYHDQYGSFDGQVRTLLRDIALLRNREDCPVYAYKKEDEDEDDAEQRWRDANYNREED